MRLGMKKPKMDDEAKEVLPDNEAMEYGASDQAQAKKLKSPAAAQKQQIASMGYRKRTPNPMSSGGRMRAADLQTGSRKRGAY